MDESVEKIQRTARVMINRLRFKKCLYRMILLRNLIEIKLHKEKMTKLFAFESFVYNLEVC